jgi:hypothetical protein
MRSAACFCNGEPPTATTPEAEIGRTPHALPRSPPSLATTEKAFVQEESSCVETLGEALAVSSIALPARSSPRIGLEGKCRSPCRRPRDSQSTPLQAAAHRHSEPAIVRSQAPMRGLVWMAPAAPDEDFHSRSPSDTRHRSVCAALFDSSDLPRSVEQSLGPLSSFPQSIVVMLNPSQSANLMNHLAGKPFCTLSADCNAPAKLQGRCSLMNVASRNAKRRESRRECRRL